MIGAAGARRLLRACAGGDPVRLGIRIAFAACALAVVGWDLPSSFSWENDGVAPRDIFAGVAENLRPGHAFRYPLLAPLALGFLCLPVLVPAALRAPSLRLDDLRAAVLAPPVMTACALIGRALAIVAAVIALASLGRIAARLAGARAARFSEAFAATNLAFVYYGRATNLDGLALAASVLAVEYLIAACDAGRRRDVERCALCAAAAVAIKDQYYAAFVLLPPVLVAVARWQPAAIAAGARARGTLARAGAVLVAAYAVGSGAAFNPSGFVTRARALLGPASGDYRAYERSAAGVLANLGDVLRGQADTFWPWPVVALAWGGVALALLGVLRRRRGALLLLPLAAGAGSLIFFVLAVGRTEHRFVLPLGFWLSLYAGLGAATLADAAARPRAARAAAAALLAWAALPPIALAITQWSDGRRDVEAWLRRQPAGTTVETYGPLVYLPRFDAAAPTRAARVGPEPAEAHNPLAGMREVQDEIANLPRRSPDVVVVTEGFALPDLAQPPAPGRVFPPLWRRARADEASARLIRDAVAGTLDGYRLCFVAAPALPAPFAWLGLRPPRVHVSTGMRTWVLARASGCSP